MLISMPDEILINIVQRTSEQAQCQLRLTHRSLPGLVDPFLFAEVNLSAENYMDRICGIGRHRSLQKHPRIIRVGSKHGTGVQSSHDMEANMHTVADRADIRSKIRSSKAVDQEMQAMFSNMANATEFECEHPPPRFDPGPIFGAWIRSSTLVTDIKLAGISGSILQDLLATKKISAAYQESLSALICLRLDLVEKSEPDTDKAALEWVEETLTEAQHLEYLYLDVNRNIEVPLPIGAIT